MSSWASFLRWPWHAPHRSSKMGSTASWSISGDLTGAEPGSPANAIEALAPTPPSHIDKVAAAIQARRILRGPLVMAFIIHDSSCLTRTRLGNTDGEAVSRPVTFGQTDSAASLPSSDSARPAQSGRQAVSQAMRAIMLNRIA